MEPHSYERDPDLKEYFPTFKGNEKKEIYNWFHFKEGFSREMVEYIFRKYPIKGKIFDPFCGSGTTLLFAKEKNIPSWGFDVMPISVFVSKVKTSNYEYEKLDLYSRIIKGAHTSLREEELFGKRKKFPLLKRAFDSGTLARILEFQKIIQNLDAEEKYKNFFTLALLNAAMVVSKLQKSGGCLKRVKPKKIPIRAKFFEYMGKMLKHVKKNPQIFQGIEPIIEEKDSRYFVPNDEFGAIITSPPYLNKIEYTKVYGIELALFFESYGNTRLRSFLGDELSKESYFSDLKKVLSNNFEVLKNGGKAFYIIAGGCLQKEIVHSDEILFNELSQEVGFRPLKLIPIRKVYCHDPNRRKIGYMHESLVILEKPS